MNNILHGFLLHNSHVLLHLIYATHVVSLKHSIWFFLTALEHSADHSGCGTGHANITTYVHVQANSVTCIYMYISTLYIFDSTSTTKYCNFLHLLV